MTKSYIEDLRLPTALERIEIQRQAEQERARFIRSCAVAAWSGLRRMLSTRRDTMLAQPAAR